MLFLLLSLPLPYLLFWQSMAKAWEQEGLTEALLGFPDPSWIKPGSPGRSLRAAARSKEPSHWPLGLTGLANGETGSACPHEYQIHETWPFSPHLCLYDCQWI